MRRNSIVVLSWLAVGLCAGPGAGIWTDGLCVQTAAAADDPPFVLMRTDAGDILLVLYPDLAPHHVAQFLYLAESGFYEETYFHRIMPGFIIQGGDPNSKDRDPRNDGLGGPRYDDVLSAEDMHLIDQLNVMLGEKGYKSFAGGEANLNAEFSKTAKHTRGTLSMARAPRDLDSAGSQFFICVGDAPQLDGQYTIFGHVVMGMEVADTIVAAPKDPARGRDAPAEPVHIRSMTVIADGLAGLSDLERKAYEELKVQK